MNSDELMMTLQIEGLADTDDDEMDELTDGLHRELAELDVKHVSRVSAGTIPVDAKPAEVVALGALLIAVAPSMVQGVFDIVAAWLERSAARSIEVEISGKKLKISGASCRDVETLVKQALEAPNHPTGPTDKG